jgi:hypothetical protein
MGWKFFGWELNTPSLIEGSPGRSVRTRLSWAADWSTSLLSISTNTISPKKRKESDILSSPFASALPHNPPFAPVRTSVDAWCSTLFWRNYSKVLMCRISRICWRNDFNMLINKALRVVRIHGQQSESKDSKSLIQSSRTRSNPRSKIGTSHLLIWWRCKNQVTKLEDIASIYWLWALTQLVYT